MAMQGPAENRFLQAWSQTWLMWQSLCDAAAQGLGCELWSSTAEPPFHGGFSPLWPGLSCRMLLLPHAAAGAAPAG